MAQHEERALVLDTMDYRESSSLVRLFAECEGKISLVARGLKKPNASSSVATVQPFNLVRVWYYIKEGATIGNMAGAELEQASKAARTSTEAYALISYWFDILKQTNQPGEAAADIFRLTTGMLDHQERTPGLSLRFIQELTMFCRYLGFGIEWSHCISCGNLTAGAAEFSIHRGGIICSNCAATEHQGLPLKPSEAATISWLASNNSREPSTDLTGGDIFKIVTLFHRYLTYHIDQPLKTFSFVKGTFGP